MPINLAGIFRSRMRNRARTRAERLRDAERVIELCRTLLSERGEVSGARIASEVLSAYKALDDEQVEWFFDQLVTALRRSVYSFIRLVSSALAAVAPKRRLP